MLLLDRHDGLLTRCTILQMTSRLLQSFALLLVTLVAGALSSDPPVSSFSPISVAPIARASLAPSSEQLVCTSDLSCVDRCNIYHVECSCQCDGDCNVVGDCCPDTSDVCGIVAVVPVAPYTQVPVAPDSSSSPVSPISTAASSIPVSQLCASGASCAGRCATFDSTCGCQCDSTCADTGDCCEDFAFQCTVPIELSESPSDISASPTLPPVVAPTDPSTDNPTDRPTNLPTAAPTVFRTRTRTPGKLNMKGKGGSKPKRTVGEPKKKTDDKKCRGRSKSRRGRSMQRKMG